jgi:hypothetical protein
VAIFGKDNSELLHQISGQLGQAIADLAALKQQVADQQHAIDRIRQDATAAITTGLAEIRAVARDGLARSNETIGSPLAQINTELVAMRGAITQLDNQIQRSVTPPTPEPTPEPEAAHDALPALESTPEPADDTPPTAEPEPQPEPEAEAEPPRQPKDTDLLTAAAGISHATIEAHRDTWAFLVEHASQDRHFRIPGKVDDHDGAVRVRVSGPSLVAAITSLDTVSRTAADPVARAIAGHLHTRLTDTVEEIITRPHRGDGAEPVVIVIDDRAAAVHSDQPPND